MKLALLQVIFTLTLFKMGIFGAAHGWGGAKRPPSLKSVTHPAMMKLGTVIPYLNKIQKNMNHVMHPLSSLLTSTFIRWKSANFVISRNADIDCILVHRF